MEAVKCNVNTKNSFGRFLWLLGVCVLHCFHGCRLQSKPIELEHRLLYLLAQHRRFVICYSLPVWKILLCFVQVMCILQCLRFAISHENSEQQERTRKMKKQKIQWKRSKFKWFFWWAPAPNHTHTHTQCTAWFYFHDCYKIGSHLVDWLIALLVMWW